MLDKWNTAVISTHWSISPITIVSEQVIFYKICVYLFVEVMLRLSEGISQ